MKIKITDSFEDAFYRMADGNPGAAACLTSMLEFSPERGMAAMFSCAKHDFYGSQLYELWNDLCNRDCEMLINIIEGIEDDDLVDFGEEEQTLDNVEEILKEVERIAIKMADSANMGHESTEELMTGLNESNLTKEQALGILSIMQRMESTIN